MTTTYDDPTPPRNRMVTHWEASPDDGRVHLTIHHGDPTIGHPEPTELYLPNRVIMGVIASLARSHWEGTP